MGVSQRMLQFEEFFNLNLETPENSTHEVINIDEDNGQNEDGPDSVPFRVHFNSLVLNN